MAGQRNEALDSFSQQLQSEDFRRSFSSDASGALKTAGVDASQIPSNVLEALSGLSYDELSTLASVQQKVRTLAADGTGCNFF
jgi:hypothetical protein